MTSLGSLVPFRFSGRLAVAEAHRGEQVDREDQHPGTGSYDERGIGRSCPPTAPPSGKGFRASLPMQESLRLPGTSATVCELVWGAVVPPSSAARHRKDWQSARHPQRSATDPAASAAWGARPVPPEPDTIPPTPSVRYRPGRNLRRPARAANAHHRGARVETGGHHPRERGERTHHAQMLARHPSRATALGAQESVGDSSSLISRASRR